MIDYSLIKLIPGEESQRQFSYELKKATYGDYIKEVWGWDEEVQIEFHNQDWLKKRPNIIRYDNRPIGTIYLDEKGNDIWIERFIISSEYQNKGMGTYILKGIMERADLSGRTIKLMYLRTNPVASLYRRMGFRETGNDDVFISVERKPGGTS